MAEPDPKFIKWDTELSTSESPAADKVVWETGESAAPAGRRDTTLKGVGSEALKGAGRGVESAYQLLKQGMGPLAEGISNITSPLLNRIAPESMQRNPELAAMRAKFLEQIKPSLNASRIEQAAGTTGELATGMLPFAATGPGGLAAKAMSIAVPTAGGVVGEQLGGDTGKFIGTLAAPVAQVAAGRMMTPRVGPPSPPTALSQTTKELHEAGIPLLPHQTEAGFIQRNVEALGGSEFLAKNMRVKAQPALQKLAAQEAGLSPTGLTEKALSNASRNISDIAYQPVRDLGTIGLTIRQKANGKYGPNLRDDLRAIEKEFSSVDQAPKIEKRIEDLRGFSSLPADSAITRIAQLRSDAAEAFRSDTIGGRTYGKALRKIADAIENQIERNLPAGSDVLKNYQAGRQQIAKNNAITDMLVDKNSGIIDSTKAHKMLENGVKLTGGLETIAKAGSPRFSASTKPPGPEPTTLNWRDIGLFGVPAAARQVIKSKPGQWMAARAKPQQSVFGDIPNEVLQRYPGVVSPFFSQGEE